VRCGAGRVRGTEVPDELPPPSPQPASVAILGPSKIDILKGHATFNIDDDLLPRLTQGEMILFMYCQVTYVDVFNKERMTDACAYYRFDLKGWTAATKHNRFT
jgi:hypothetical protein